MSRRRSVRNASIVVGSWRPRERTVGLVRRACGTALRRSPSTSRRRFPKRSRRFSNSFCARSTRCSTCARVCSTWSRTSSLPQPGRAARARAASAAASVRRAATVAGLALLVAVVVVPVVVLVAAVVVVTAVVVLVAAVLLLLLLGLLLILLGDDAGEGGRVGEDVHRNDLVAVELPHLDAGDVELARALDALAGERADRHHDVEIGRAEEAVRAEAERRVAALDVGHERLADRIAAVVVAGAGELLALRGRPGDVVGERAEEAVDVALAERLQRLLHRLRAAADLGRQRRLAGAHPLLRLLADPAALVRHAAPPGPCVRDGTTTPRAAGLSDAAADRVPRVRRALALVVLALGLRLAGAAASADIPLTFDPIDFDRHARSIVVNHGYPGAVHPRGGPSALRPPGYPLALAAAYLLRGGAAAPEPTDVAFAPGHQPPRAQVTAGRLEQALIGTLMVVLTGLVALQLWGRRVALAALAIGAVYLPLIAVGLTLLSDPLFVVLMLAAVSAALRSRDQERPAAGRRWAAVAGALAGLAWLTRSNGGALLLPLGLLVWTARPRLRLRSLAAPAVMVAAALLVIAPWTIRNAIVLDAFVPVSDNAGYTLAGTYNPVAAHDAHFRGGWRPAQEDPGNAALIAASRDELDQARRLGRAARRYIREDPSYV